ncbi:Predicted signal-transduction protein containing cAMP-binding and CBS domains [Olavius algarvensis associated proteobacterium Delta 3]|nr:Predicted signal-transduction protein containing cAMP-binding and CBS domains [Olavius algarvensis associated proteobacterium Delta 3]
MGSDAFTYISSMPHFSFLPENERRRLAEAITIVRHPAGTLFAEQGRSSIDSIFIPVEGSLALFTESENDKTLSGYIRPGDVFGGISILLNGGISLRTVEVENDCAGYAVGKDVFLDVCARYGEFFDYFLENFSKNMFDPSMSALIETGQLRRFLSAIEPFSFLPGDELERIAGEMTVVQYPRGTIPFVQGATRIGYLYILQKGSAERYFEENGSHAMKELLGEGDIYGGISMLLHDGISVRTVKILETATFYLLPKKRFLEICRNYESVTEFFTDIFGKRMLEKSYASVVAKTMANGEESLQFFNQHVASIYSREPIFGSTSLSIRDAAEIMAGKNISALYLKSETDDCVGVVTERDLTSRVIAAGVDVKRPVSDIMSSPVTTVSEFALIFEAMMIMMESNIRHLAVTDVDETVVGVLSDRDLLSAQGQSPVFLIREIADAASIDEIIACHHRLPQLIRNLITSGARADNVTQFITTVSDGILNKIMSFTLEKMGPPPARFVFMILGSEGRREQTLKTDQDNAIIFEDVPESSESEVRDYFLKFGEIACDMLDQAGYDFCTGGVMAKNPKWCQSLATWKSYFSNWIRAAEAEDLLQASIFFDFRGGYGEFGLIDDLRKHLFASLGGWAGFFRHLAENALNFRPPLGFFGTFVVESKGEHRDKFDIKLAMTPIVDFARIYALRHNVVETNTLDRLAYLRRKEILRQKEYEELEKAYGFMLQLRFVRQITAIVDEKSKPDNYINPKNLTRIEQKMLKEIFARVGQFQSKLEFDFIGTI